MMAGRAADDALRTIGVLFRSEDVIEIRALNVKRTKDGPGYTYSGYFQFESGSEIRKAVQKLDGCAEGVYIVLNRLNPVLLARASNRLQYSPKWATSDKDIIEWRWLYIDCDSERPAGISATDQEHKAALDRAATIREFLSNLGWPEPIYCDSGNGGHLLYLLPALDLERARQLVKLCLKALAARFSDALVKVDESTSNAARLCKLYGTMTRKGDAMPDRPHRRSQIIDDPERIEPLSVEALEALASEAQPSPPRATPKTQAAASNFRIDEWLADHGPEISKGPEPYEGGRRWILRTCPFNPEHQEPAVIELSNGALVYKCLHKSCDQNDWRALRTLCEPGYSWAAPSTRPEGGDPESEAISPLITDLRQIPSVWTLEMNLNWCVHEMIAQGSITLICSESGTGKTWLGYYIAGCIAHGRPLIGRVTRPSKVLYADGENPLYVVKQRLFDLGITQTDDLIVWGGWNNSPPPGPNSPLVIEFASRHKGLIIYDSLVEFHPGCEQSSTETRAFMRQFRKLAHLGATVVVLHHTGKAETSKQYRGSSDIKAAVDTAYLLEKVSGESESLGKLSLTCFKGRLMPGQNFGLEYIKGQGFLESAHVPRKRSLEEVIAEILEETPGVNQRNLVRLAGAAGFSKERVLAYLETNPLLKERGPHNSNLYYLPKPNGPRRDS